MIPAILSKTWWRSLVKGEDGGPVSEEFQLAEEEHEEEEEEEEVEEAFDDEEEDLPEEDFIRPVKRGRVDSAKEFFSSELVYRFEILQPAVQEELRGRYRVEVKGNAGGTWTVVVDKGLQVANERQDAEVVLSLQQKDFIQLVNGDLNPQMGILAQKIRLQGDVRKVASFQTLLYPVGPE